jgi:hypothetical protein
MRCIPLLTVFVALCGVEVSPLGAQQPTKPPRAASTKPVVSDLQLEQDIRSRLAKSKLNSEHFSVSVRNGVATFEGKTAVLQHKGVATRIARSAGALAVRNNIQVSSEARARAARNLGGVSEGPPKAVVKPFGRPF